MIDVLVYKLLHENHHEFVIQHRTALRWASLCNKHTDDHWYTVLGIILDYDLEHGMCPPSPDALRQFTITSDDFTIKREGETIHQCLDVLNDIDETRLTELTDMNVLIDYVVKEARKEYHLYIADMYATIVHQGPSPGKGANRKYLAGCNDAMTFARKHWAKDLPTEIPLPEGMLHEHVQDVAKALDARLEPTDNQVRIRLGFPHVDRCVVIGPSNRFIGIMGMSGDGKTTILNTIVYNILKDGHNVLYVSLEHSPQEIWEFMAFLHSSHPDYDFRLPSLSDWDLGRDPKSGVRITHDDQANMARVLHDIKHLRNLSGKLDARQMFTWDEIVNYLECHKESHYRVLVIDYLARLDVPGDARFRDKEIGKTIHKAQLLTRSFNDGKGIVVITPMQVNREGNKNAKKAELCERHYDINAISSFSEYQHDMDYIFGVWSDDVMRLKREILMETVKLRKGVQPMPETLKIDPRSGLVAPEQYQPPERRVPADLVEAIDI